MIKIPHAVINGDVTVTQVFEQLEPFSLKLENTIIKALNFYLSKNSTSCLIESLSIESGKKTSFFTLINQRDDGIVIRISPMSNIEKTEGIKTLLAEIAIGILKNFKNTTLGRTNLEKYFESKI